MSWSRRKPPSRAITTTDREKQEKRVYNRRFHDVAEQVLRADPTGEGFSVLCEYSNPWYMDEDGKACFGPTKYPKSMRKQKRGADAGNEVRYD